MEDETAEVIKIFSIEDRITALNFGPYDNGYLLIGLRSGQLLVFDTIHLQKIQCLCLFQAPIISINFEPTSLIFIGSSSGEVIGLNIIEKELHYVYLDLGKKQYCTVALPKKGVSRNGG